MRDCLVIGAGVSGLTTAMVLADAGWSPRVLARESWRQSTSAVAGGLCMPFLAGPRARCVDWTRRTLDRFYGLAEDPSSGVLIRTCLDLARSPVEAPWWGPSMRDLRRLNAEELPPGFVDGFVFSTAMLSVPDYMSWLEQQLERRGVPVTIDGVGLSRLDPATHPVIINCTGLGARELVGDQSLLPVRGQVVRVKNVGQTRCSLDEQDPERVTYIMARRDDVILGGSAEPGEEDLTENRLLTDQILHRAARLDPRLAAPALLDVRVGLRPTRPEVRLERDADYPGILVHNYGHGGAGYTLSWACAEDVAALLV